MRGDLAAALFRRHLQDDFETIDQQVLQSVVDLVETSA
jgi:hypothetical protein